MNLRQELAADIAAERFDVTTNGIYFPRQGVLANGEYFGRVNGGAWEKDGDNLLPTEGLAHLLSVALGTTAKPTGYYLAIFSGSTSPAANWTAASFAAVANEKTILDMIQLTLSLTALVVLTSVAFLISCYLP